MEPRGAGDQSGHGNRRVRCRHDAVEDPGGLGQEGLGLEGDLRREISDSPEAFTYWLRLALRELERRGALPGTAEEQVA